MNRAESDFARLLGLRAPEWVPCPRCGDLMAAASRPVGAPAAAGGCWECWKKDCAREEALRRTTTVGAAVPAAFRNINFANVTTVRPGLIPEAVLDEAKDCIDVPRIVFQGPPGTGKTTLACCMLRAHWHEHGVPSLFVAAQSLSGGSFELDALHLHAPLVLIDDIGCERQMASNKLPDLVNARHHAGLHTWFTTNLDADAMARLYGDHLARRVYESAVIFRLGES